MVDANVDFSAVAKTLALAKIKHQAKAVSAAPVALEQPLLISVSAQTSPLLAAISVSAKASCEIPLSRGALLNDLANLRHLISTNNSFKKPADFAVPSHYQKWRVAAEHSVDAAIRKLSATSVHKSGHAQGGCLVTICANAAQGLTAKDANGSCNPYATISYSAGGKLIAFQSKTIDRTLNPEWNLSATLLVYDTSDPVVISVWNSPSSAKPSLLQVLRGLLKKDKHTHAFLGTVSASGASIISNTRTISDQWLPLSKRSRRSRVSGRLHVRMEKLPSLSSSFECIPTNPFAAYAQIAKACMEYEHTAGKSSKNMNSALLSTDSWELLQTLAEFWIIDDAARYIIELDVFSSGYELELITSKAFFERYNTIINRIESARRNEIMTVDELARYKELILHVRNIFSNKISTFFDQPIEQFTAASPREFLLLVSAAESLNLSEQISSIDSGADISLSTIQLIGSLITESITIRFRRIMQPEAHEKFDGVTLERGTTQAIKELEVFLAVFDELILGKFHLPTIAATIYIEGLVQEVMGYKSKLVETETLANNLDVGFSVYMLIKNELILVCEKIDYRLVLSGQLPVTDMFRVFVEEFVRLSDNKINEWVQNAVAVDNFELLSSGHSSSVFDIFVSFQQQIDFVLRLDWPSESDVSLFLGKLIENIGQGLEKYANLMKISIETEFKALGALAILHSSSGNSNLASASAETPTPTSAKKFKFKVRKQGPAVDPTEIRISEASCVKLSNIEFLLPRFGDLVNTIPSEYRAGMRLANASVSHLPLGPTQPRIAGMLTVVSAEEMNVARPYALQVSFRISTFLLKSKNDQSATGRELGRTGKKHQCRSIEFAACDSAEIPVLLTDAEIAGGLQITLVHHVPRSLNAKVPGNSSTEYIIDTASFPMGAIFENAVALGERGYYFRIKIGGGSVVLRLTVEDGLVAGFIKKRLAYVFDRTIHESLQVAVDKLCYDLRIRLKDASADHKQSVIIANNIANLFSSKQTKRNLAVPLSSAETPTELTVDTKISPLLIFIDSNLAVIAQNIPNVELGNRIVDGIWTRFVEIAESLLVPNLGDDSGLLERKKVWELPRVAFLAHTVLLVKDFLHSEGKGLAHARMENEGLRQLKLIIDHYSWQRKDLVRMHSEDLGQTTDWSDVWCLKLLKLKGSSVEYINDAMRRKIGEV